MQLSVVSEKAWMRTFRTEALSGQGNRCRYCFEPLTCKTATADHIIARRNGGTTNSKNIAAACALCNLAKGHLSASEFMASIKNPPRGATLRIWMAWSRRRLWLATHRACTRIMKAAI